MERTSLANAIVELFNNFYTVYLKDDNNSEKPINCNVYINDIRNYYNEIQEELDGKTHTDIIVKSYPIENSSGIDGLKKDLNDLSSDYLEVFLENLLDFIKVYKLETLNIFYKCRKIIECMSILNKSVSLIKNRQADGLIGVTTILKKINNFTDVTEIFEQIEEKKNEFTNAEKYLADLIVAIGKGNKNDIYLKLGNLKKAYTKGVFFKDNEGLKLIVKTVKELGITEEYGKSMKKIDIGLYYKKMTFENPNLVTKGKFKSWKGLKQEIKGYVDAECEIMIDDKKFTELAEVRNYTAKNDFDELKWNNQIFKSYKDFENSFFEKIFSNTELFEENKIEKKDKNLIKELYLMDSPHAHHVLYKGWENNRIWKKKKETDEDFKKRKAEFDAKKEANKELYEKIKKAREVLWEYDIDPYVGLENLCWAPNINPVQHNDEHIRIIADELISFYNENAPREKILEYLEKMKEVARNLWKNYK